MDDKFASQTCPSAKDNRPSAVICGSKSLNSAEKSSGTGHVSPQCRSPKREAGMGSSLASSTTGIGHIPGDGIVRDAAAHKNASVNTSGGSTSGSSKSTMYGSIFGKEGPIQGGMNPSFLFLQLYHANFFGASDDRPLHLPATEVSYRKEATSHFYICNSCYCFFFLANN